MADAVPAPPHGRYRRAIQGATFSLEANTETVPSDGRFYLIREGEITLATEEFAEALGQYNELCRAFWTERLDSEDIPVRVAAAWGLLTLDPTDKVAINIIQTDGTAQERKRLDQAQSRRRALRSRAQGKSNAAAKAAAPAAETTTEAATPDATDSDDSAATPAPVEATAQAAEPEAAPA